MSSSTTSRYRESAAVTAPSKVHDQSNTSFAEEHALDAIAKEAELRLQHQREQTREARQLRHKELEKNARDDDLGDSTTTTNTTRSRLKSTDGVNSSAMGSNQTNSTFLQKFLNGDIDLRTTEQRDLRRLLSELESKYKAAMIANSSIYNEKQALKYQVETFKDILDEYYETLAQTKRQYKEKSRDFDLQKRTLNELEHEHNQLKEILLNREKLIEESGMQLLTNDEITSNDKLTSVFPTGLITQETLTLLNSLGKGSIDDKFKQLITDKHEQYEEILRLKSELEDERNRSRLFEKQTTKTNDLENVNGTIDSEQQKQLIKELTDLKSRLPRLEADHLSLQQENKRFDAQLKRQKQQIEEMEKIEEDLKQERRKLQRELRVVREELENERTRSDVLQRENERLRTLRKKTLLTPNDDTQILSALVSRSHTNSPLPPLLSSSSSSISTVNDPSSNPSTPDPLSLN